LVTSTGVVTNQHVVEGCSRLRVRTDDATIAATVAASTKRSDLALFSLSQGVGVPAAVRTSALLGEEVTVAGYPLSGLLSSDIIVTSGQVNSLAGVGNDPTLLQISAPVQPGNSGGPVIDKSGEVVGVVVSKLNAERIARVTGDIAQNVNFAIKAEVLRLFLDANRVQYRTPSSTRKLDGVQIAQRARQYTVQVLCEE
jgi:S1-C subfamily serine protease